MLWKSCVLDTPENLYYTRKLGYVKYTIWFSSLNYNCAICMFIIAVSSVNFLIVLNDKIQDMYRWNYEKTLHKNITKVITWFNRFIAITHSERKLPNDSICKIKLSYI